MYFGKIGPIAGCLSSICFTLCWIVSALIWEDWTLGSYALSDLGVCGIVSAVRIYPNREQVQRMIMQDPMV